MCLEAIAVILKIMYIRNMIVQCSITHNITKHINNHSNDVTNS